MSLSRVCRDIALRSGVNVGGGKGKKGSVSGYPVGVPGSKRTSSLRGLVMSVDRRGWGEKKREKEKGDLAGGLARAERRIDVPCHSGRIAWRKREEEEKKKEKGKGRTCARVAKVTV